MLDAEACSHVMALVAVLEALSAIAAGDLRSAVVGADYEHRLDRRGSAQRDEHVAEHRLSQGLSLAGAQARAQPTFGLGERLDRQDRDGRHRRRERNWLVA